MPIKNQKYRRKSKKINLKGYFSNLTLGILTLMTSMSGGTSQTMGIYSNFSNFKLSERLQFNTGFHLFQKQNNFSYSNAPQTGIGYELGLEYKLSPNSIITIQMVNYNNAPIRYGNRSPLNAP